MTIPRRLAIGILGALSTLAAPWARADHNENVTALATLYVTDEQMEKFEDEYEDRVLEQAKAAAFEKCRGKQGRPQTTNFEEIFTSWNGTAGCHPSGQDTSGFYPEQREHARCTGSYTVRCRLPDIVAATDDFKKPATELRVEDGRSEGGAGRAGD